MRTAVLYTIEEQNVPVHGDITSFYRHNMLPSLEDMLVAEGQVIGPAIERIDVPIKRIHETVRDPENHEVRIKESYIAIEPKLERIITAQMRQLLEEANKAEAAARALCGHYQQRIGDYNDLPWYKRIFQKV